MAPDRATARRKPPLSDAGPVEPVERCKRAAAEAAAAIVEDQMRVGLGTGSTVAYLLPALASEGPARPALRGHLAGDRAGGPGAGAGR